MSRSVHKSAVRRQEKAVVSQAFTLRLDGDLASKVAKGYETWAVQQGFRPSRNQYIEWVLRRHFAPMSGTDPTS